MSAYTYSLSQQKSSRKPAKIILAGAKEYETQTSKRKMHYLGNKQWITWKQGKINIIMSASFPVACPSVCVFSDMMAPQFLPLFLSMD